MMRRNSGAFFDLLFFDLPLRRTAAGDVVVRQQKYIYLIFKLFYWN
jgi:hypothetical protein